MNCLSIYIDCLFLLIVELGLFARLKLTAEDLEKKGIHPSFGEVSLSQLLSTWLVHDLNHLSQISRVMAKQYSGEVGPWKE